MAWIVIGLLYVCLIPLNSAQVAGNMAEQLEAKTQRVEELRRTNAQLQVIIRREICPKYFSSNQ